MPIGPHKGRCARFFSANAGLLTGLGFGIGACVFAVALGLVGWASVEHGNLRLDAEDEMFLDPANARLIDESPRPADVRREARRVAMDLGGVALWKDVGEPIRDGAIVRDGIELRVLRWYPYWTFKGQYEWRGLSQRWIFDHGKTVVVVERR